MKRFKFTREMGIPIALNEAWDFFSNPNNLAKITPSEMQFNVLTKNLPDKIYNGLKIDYTIKPLFNISITWQTNIAEVAEPQFFIDEQVKGPYKVWIHKHTFTETNLGVLMKDEVEYSLPFAPLDGLLNKIVIRKKLENIFDYRLKAIKEHFKIIE